MPLAESIKTIMCFGSLDWYQCSMLFTHCQATRLAARQHWATWGHGRWGLEDRRDTLRAGSKYASRSVLLTPDWSIPLKVTKVWKTWQQQNLQQRTTIVTTATTEYYFCNPCHVVCFCYSFDDSCWYWSSDPPSTTSTTIIILTGSATPSTRTVTATASATATTNTTTTTTTRTTTTTPSTTVLLLQILQEQ